MFHIYRCFIFFISHPKEVKSPSAFFKFCGQGLCVPLLMQTACELAYASFFYHTRSPRLLGCLTRQMMFLFYTPPRSGGVFFLETHTCVCFERSRACSASQAKPRVAFSITLLRRGYIGIRI